MTGKINLNIRGAKGIFSSHKITTGKDSATIIKVPQNGAYNIELIDESTGLAPQLLMTKRIGKNLVLVFEDENANDVILENYYDNDELHLIGKAENGQFYEYVPTSGNVSEYTPALMEGNGGEVALGGEGSTIANPVANDNQFAWLPFLLLGAATAGVGTAYAVSNHGKDHNDQPTAGITVTINPPTDEDKDGRPEISGTSSSPSANVEITLPDGSIITTQTDENGNWYIEAPTSQPNGMITVVVKDQNGNTGTATENFVDSTAPDAPVVSVNNNEQLAGSAEPDSIITLTNVNTGEVITVNTDSNGQWSVDPGQLGENVDNVILTAEDPSGNVSPPTVIVRPDVTIPDNITSGIVSGSINLIDDVDPITGTIADGGVTNDTRPTYTGKATPDIDHVNIYDKGTLIGSAVVDSNGNWFFTPPVSLVEGSIHEFTVAAVDKAGNEGAQVSGTSDAGWTFTIDSLAPDNNTSGIVGGSMTLSDDVAPLLGLIADGGTTNDSRPTYAGQATDDISHVNVYDNGVLIGSAAVDANGAWSFTPEADLAEGAHEFTVAAVDKSGNEGAQVSGTSDAGWTFTIDSLVPDNNTSGIVGGSMTLSDDVAPLLGLIADGGTTNDSRPTYAGQATDDISHVNVYDNGVLIGSAAVDANGAWSFTPEADLAEGAHEFTVAAVDKSGNEGAQVSGTSDAGWTFTIDSLVPDNNTSGIVGGSVTLSDDVAPLLGLIADGGTTNDSRPTYAGQATDDISHVNVYDNGVLIGSAAVDANGAWSFTPEADLAEGAHEFTVAAVDKAGNEGAQVSGTSDAGWTFTIDSLVPDNNTSGIVGGSVTLSDDVAPLLGLIADGGTTNDSRPTYAGQATDDISHVNVYDNGVLIGSAAVDANGAWSFTPEADLAEGAHEFTVAAVDKAGNEGAQFSGTSDAGWSFIVDTVIPGVDAFEPDSLTLIDDVGPVQGVVVDGSVIDDTQPTYRGTVSTAGLADGVVSVNIYDNGVLIGNAAVDANTGAWSFTPGTVLASGEHGFTVAAVDRAGNVGAQVSGTDDAAWNFTLLTSAPAQPSIENVQDDYTQGEDADTGYLQKGQSTNDSTLTINGSAGAGMTVQIWATDGSGNRVQVGEGVADGNGRWSITTSALGADGSYNLTATAVNAAGVSSAETGAFPIILDTVAPAAAVASLMDRQGDVQGEIAAGGVTDDRTPQLVGTGEAGATVHVYLDGSATPMGSTVVDGNGNWSLVFSPLGNGVHSYQTKITDAAGNETRGESVSFTVDSSNVAITIDQANDDVGLITGAILNGGLTDDNTLELQGTTQAGATVTLRDADGVVLGSTTANAQGVWTYALPTVADGTHHWTAEVTNLAGNTAQAELTLTVDTTPPTVPVITTMEDDVGTVQGSWSVAGNVTDDPAPTFSGTAEPGTLITVYDGELVLGSVTADQNGAWTYTPTTNLMDGEHGISVTSTDHAGNVSAHSPVWDFTLDTSTTEPTITINTIDELTGTAEPGATITITDPSDGSTTTVVTDPDGQWSLQPNPIEVGDAGVEITATDPAGNTSTIIVDGPQDTTAPDNITSGIVGGSVTLSDDVAPVLGLIADGGTTNDSRPTYAGQATDDISHVNVYDNGVLIGSAAVDANGAWSFTPEADLAEGAHEFTVAAVDKAGNEGAQFSGTSDAGWSFIVDTVIPGVDAFEPDSLTLIDDVGSVQGVVVDGSVIDDTQPTYRGTVSTAGLADGVVSVNIYDNGVLIGNAAVDANTGAWSFTPGTVLASGEHGFTVAAVDRAGNVGAQVSGTDDAAWNFTLLTSAPAQPSIENVQDDYTQGEDADTGYLQKGQSTNDSTLTINGSAGAGMTVQIWATDGSGNRVQVGEGVADGNGRWSITTSALGADGSYNLTATAVNAAGVSSAETGAFPIILDTVAPAAAVASLMDRQGDVQGEIAAGGVTDDRTPQLVGTGEAGATVHVYLDGSATPMGSTVVDGNGNWSLVLSPQGNGVHSYQTKITDAAGNETRGESVSFTVDSSNVAITIDQANDDVGLITGAILNGGLTDDNTLELQGTTQAGATVTLRDADGVVLGSTTANAQGVWTYALPTVADGTHRWTAEVTNLAGNTAQAELTLTVDTTPPAVPVITTMEDDVGTVQGSWSVAGNVTDDPAPTFSGTAEPGTLITVYDGELVLGSVTADQNGAWTYTPTTNLMDGEHGISVTSTDHAGNVSAHSPVWDFTLDTSTTEPTITINTIDELTGTAEPGATITITDPSDGSTTTVVTDPDGQWSLQPNPIEVGDAGVEITATDPAGNTSTIIVDGPQDTTAPDNITSGIVGGSVTLSDDVAPLLGLIADGGTTNDSRPTYAGQATDDISHVNVYDNGVLIGSAAVDANGAWSFTPEADLAEGAHEFTVAAVDKAGNEGAQFSGTSDAGWSFIVDTVIPGVDAFEPDSLTLFDDVGPVQGVVVDGSVIDDTQPTYRGTVSTAGLADGVVSVNIYDNGVLIGNAAVDANTGAWSFTPGTVLASGEHGFTVAAVDRAGNVGAQVSGTDDAAWNFTLLTSAPAQPSIENVQDDYTQGEDADTGYLQKGQSTNDSTLTINGSAGAGMTVQIWATDGSGNRVQVGEGVADGNGRWSITTSALGADGSYNLTATAVNAAGVSSAETGAFPIILDTVAPAAAVASLMDRQGDVQGEIAAGGVTDDRTPQLVGTGEAGATVHVYLDGSATPMGSTVVDGNGNWSLVLSPQGNGVHSYQTKITDAAGNETRGESVSFTVDSSNVAITIDQANDDVGLITGAILNGGLTDDNTLELQGTTQAGATVTLRDADGVVLGSTTANAQGVWTYALPTVADGTHHWTAEVTNLAGNTAQAELTLTVDTTPPAVPVITTMEDDVGTVQGSWSVAGNVTDDPAPTFSGTAEPGTLITVYDGELVLGSVTADQNGAWTYTPTTNLIEGVHSVTVTATDAAGNVSEPSSAWNVVLDITAPNIGISANSADSLSGMSEPGVLITITNSVGDKYTTIADQDGRWMLVPNPLAAGESGTIYATDTAGNAGKPIAFQGAALTSYNLLNESVQVNTSTSGDQANPSTTRLADGRIIVVWQGAGVSGTEVFMQLYEADGVHKIGTEQQVNQRTNNNQDSPQVVALADGGFLIVYESYQGGLDNSSDGVVARRFGADGQAVTDEFLVNTTTSGEQNRPSAMATADGGYIITWEDQGKSIVQRTYDADNTPVTGEEIVAGGTGMGSNGGPEMAAFTDEAHDGMYIVVWNATSGPLDTSNTGIVGQIFKADGKPLGSVFQVNTTMDGLQNYPDVVTLKDGSFLVYWDTGDRGANGSDIRAAHYTVDPVTGALSVKGTGDFIVNTYTAGKQYKPVGVALEDGGYLLIWGSEGGDGNGSAIYAQRFDASDNRIGREFIVNTVTQGNQGTGGDSVDATHILDAVLTADGNVYVSWQSDNVDGSGMGVEGIVINPDAAYYSEFTVNTTTAGNQQASAVAGLPDGGSIVVWQSASGDGSGTCIKGQLLDAKGQPIGGEFTVNTTVAGDQLSPSVAVLGDGSFEVVWTSGNYIKGQKFTYSYDGNGEVNGAKTSGAEFNVNSGTAASSLSEPEIVTLNDGGYMVFWQASVDNKWQVYGRQYDDQGTPVTAQMVLASTTLRVTDEHTGWLGEITLPADWKAMPTATVLANGKVAIAYCDNGTGYDSYVQIYDTATHTSGTAFVVNQTTANNQGAPKVSALENGNFVVTWYSTNNSGPDQNGTSAWGRLYDAEGNALSNEFIVNTATVGNQLRGQVVSRADGSFVIVYVSQADGAPGAGTSGIYAQYFDANGHKVGQEFRINQLTYGEQVEVDAAFMTGGQLYVTWTDQGVGDGSGSSIKGRLVDLDETLGLEQGVVPNSDPTLVEYQPSTNPGITGVDTLPPNVGISYNTENKLGGQTEPGATVTVTDAAGKVHTAVADENGSWAIEPNPLKTGENGYISASDAVGNSSEPVLIKGSALDGYNLLNESVQVNTSTSGDQANPSTTRLADGRIIVVWQGAGVSGTEVFMQLYEADGVHKIGTEQQVNQRTNNNQDSPQVVALADGGFLIVYESYQGGLDNSSDGVVARRFGADGQAVTDEFLVNTTTSGEQNRPSAMATADGGYIITWEDQGKSIVQRTYDADNTPVTGEEIVAGGTGMGSNGGPEMAAFTDEAHDGMYIVVWNATSGPLDTSNTGIVGQIFKADGKPLGSVFQVNTTMDGLQNYPDVVTLKDGSFLVYWDTGDRGANGSDIRAAHYTVDPVTGALSVKGTGDFIVNTYTAGKQYKPVGVALEDGGYLLIWGSEGGDGNGSAIYAQRFDASDNRIGREFIVNTVTQGNQGTGGDSVDATHILDAVLTADGNVYVSWQSDNVDGSGMGVEGIVINPDAAYYSEFTVNTTTAGNQQASAVAGLPDGGSIVVWQSASGDGSGTCIKGQLLDAKGQPIGGEFTVNTTVAGDQLSPSVAVLGDGSFEVVWTSGNYIKGQKFTYSYDGNGEVNGAKTSGAEFNVNSGTAASSLSEPEIVTLNDGGYMVFWQASVDNKWQVYGRQYDDQGTPVTAQMVLASTTLRVTDEHTGWLGEITLPADWKAMPTATVLANGKVAIAYCDNGTGYDSYVQIYDTATHTSGTAFVVNQTTANNQGAPKVSALENGNFVVTWYSTNNSGPDQNGTSAWGRLYDAEGNALSNEFIVNTATVGNQSRGQVVSHADGSFVIVYVSQADGAPGAGTSGIYAQYFDANGHKVGQEFRINQLTYGEQVEVDAAFMTGGQLYVTWTDQGVGDGSGSSIKGRLVDLDATLGLVDSSGGVTHLEYKPAQFYLNGTEGHDALDGRGAITVDGKGGDDTIFINSTSFTSMNGGEGYDTLVWDSNNNFELGSVSSKITGIEVIHIGNSAAQTLVISASDVLEMTKDNGENGHVLRITGDDGNSSKNGARDTVSIDRSLWEPSSSLEEKGVTYDVYVNNDDSTIKLMIQHGMNVV
ncbi:hypothetical protein CRN79_03455 [Serratia fonticola]|uniref:Ig-like domain-containing protein n=1 Tax=Serratia fonticola TaxID=47917 RepID=UPI000BFDC9C8|nr:Ig-like domain-containing protein [Serratia fonticola]ATM74959.1 hypothetical protein CRN79_03455 [Serratia fonticola]